MQVAERPAQAQQWKQVLRASSMVLVCAAALLCVVHTIRWPLVGDSAVLHYGSFLISQGKMPYQDFVEPDFPGTYMAESSAMHVFGGGDLGWHVYDLFLLGLLSAACIAIAKPYQWFAGLFAGVSFALIHLGYGPRNAAQREEVMTVCLLLALAFLFRANRSRKAWPMLPFGLFMGLAASIKPAACLLGVVALLMLVLAFRKERVPVTRFCGLALLGFLAVASLSVLFLWRYHAFHAFLFNVRVVIPYYAKVGVAPVSDLLRAIVRPVRGALVLGLVLAFLQRKVARIENWERCVLLMAIGFGLFSHLIQRKNFEHHLYAFYALVLLFFFIEAFKALDRKGAIGVAGALAVTYGLATVAFHSYRLQKLPGADPATPAMMADLTRLGGQSLRGKVQCLDLVLACDSALYRLKLVENTAFLNDFTVLPSPGVPALPYYRQLLGHELQVNPPAVIIVTNQQLAHGNSFDKLQQWPEFASVLDSEYSLDATRAFGIDAYRVYVRRTPGSNAVPASRSSPDGVR